MRPRVPAPLAGVLLALPYLHDALAPLVWVCWTPLLVAARGRSWGALAGLGLGAGWLAHLAGYPWIVAALRDFGGLPLPAALAGWAAICFQQAGLVAAILLLAAWLERRRAVRPVFAFPLALVAVEYLYPRVFETYLGNPLLPQFWPAQIADLGGVFLLSALAAVVNAAAATRRRGDAALACAAVVAALLYAQVRVPAVDAAQQAAPRLRIGVIQAGNPARESLADPAGTAALYAARTRDLAAAEPGLDLILWPETAYRFFANRARDLRAALGAPGLPVLFGALREDGGTRTSLVLADAAGSIVDHYDKIVLLPFGEYIPLGATFPFLYRWMGGLEPVVAGRSRDPIRLGAWRFGPSLCYEDVLPRAFHALVRGPAPPHALFNASNDSWYGRTFQQHEHVLLSGLRAIEYRRWLVRATNTGHSTVVDAAGRLVRKTPLFEPAALVEAVPMLEGRTLYQRLGDWPAWLALLTCAVILLYGRAPRAPADPRPRRRRRGRS